MGLDDGCPDPAPGAGGPHLGTEDACELIPAECARPSLGGGEG